MENLGGDSSNTETESIAVDTNNGHISESLEISEDTATNDQSNLSNGVEDEPKVMENDVENLNVEETKDVVARLEEEFKDRYTENDAAHKAVQELKDPAPPVVEDLGVQK